METPKSSGLNDFQKESVLNVLKCEHLGNLEKLNLIDDVVQGLIINLVNIKGVEFQKISDELI